MPANTFGEIFRITTFGESHGQAVGVVVDGCPAGLAISENDIQKDLDRRRPGQSKITTPRDEPDKVQILSGVFEGKTTGAPICLMVVNENQKSQDYDKLKDLYRPGHADFTFDKKFGHRDPRGGGRTSARIMIGRVAAGAIAKKFLKEKLNMEFLAYTESVGNIKIPESDNKNYSDIEIPTERLLLKSISFDYLQEIFENCNSDIIDYLSFDAPTKINQTAEFIAHCLTCNQKGVELQLVILDKETKEFLGCCGLHNLDTKFPDFGIWLKKGVHRKAFGKETIISLKNWAEQNLDLEYLRYRVEKRNIPSRKIAESLGGKFVEESFLKTPKGRELEFLEYHIYPQIVQDLQDLQEILEEVNSTSP